MATVRPFRALRYHVPQFPNPAALLAPPYDVISPAEQAALYERHPNNIIRLEYGMTTPQDTAEDNRYTRALATLRNWMYENVLVMEEQPCFYPHQQRYTWAGQSHARNGFFAAVRLLPFEAGEILPHEFTLKGPKQDRLQLMHTCMSSFSPVFGLFDGRNSDACALLTEAARQTPLMTAQGYGFDETLWRIEAAEVNAAIADGLAKRQILIADGHHRYETMLALRERLRAEFPDAPETAAFNYVFMLLVDIQDPGLRVLPTHRLLLLTAEMANAFCRVAGDAFTMEKIAVAHPDLVTEMLNRHQDEHAFIWYANGEYTLLTSPKTSRNGLPILDVQMLQERIIAPLFALDPAGEASVERNVRYTIYPDKAVGDVNDGDVQAAVFLNPTPVADVFTLASAGVRLPQKSTYFYPKVPTGLVMHSLLPEVQVG